MKSQRAPRRLYEYFCYADTSDGKNWRLCCDSFLDGKFVRTLDIDHTVDKPNVTALNKELRAAGKLAVLDSNWSNI